ncbi:MAG: tRNA (N6-isopentenyl adenosine(37)-C2)-methylthiotransferase MiaB [Bacilli bacterium]|jgi:tRNA-2-methylthio-N6-dimethylallyladenosine synthase|nr:tRNA (N6-isopentenyl adenosine(37)-C2)-methylthiotransferase MiaB [Bacilli bacterium]
MKLPDIKEARVRTKSKTEVLYDKYKVPSSVCHIGQGKTYSILTYGCQMNVHDSENIKGIMEDLGYNEEENYEKADVIILNTCAIRENAHNKVVGILGRIKKLKEDNPNIITIIGGCMPQEEGISNMLKDKYKWVDIVLGTHNIYDIPTLLDNVTKEKKQNIEVYSIEGDIIENLPVKRDSNYKAWVNIQYGCDKFCSYCIVPYTRGKQRSRLPKDILKEINSLKEKGYKEVTLLGQNVNAYGKDLDINYTMSNLLEDTAKTGIDRIRFVTSHPWDFSSDMIDTIAKYDNIMPYIHLPIQSGSDNILKKMNRRYTIEEYKKLFYELKSKIKNVSITTDIIVGFPNETEEDFQKTLDIYNELKYDLAYTFIYSPREGTPASKMEDSVPLEEKEERLQRLNKIVNKYAKEANEKYLGKTVPVLLEGYSDKGGKLMGYTDTMKLVNVVADPSLIGQIKNVLITDVKTWSMEGEIVSDRK